MTLNKDNKKTEYNNINNLSTNIFDFIKDYLISDGNFIYFYDKVFDDYTLFNVIFTYPFNTYNKFSYKIFTLCL